MADYPEQVVARHPRALSFKVKSSERTLDPILTFHPKSPRLYSFTKIIIVILNLIQDLEISRFRVKPGMTQ
jgi:hypothetical protein